MASPVKVPELWKVDPSIEYAIVPVPPVALASIVPVPPGQLGLLGVAVTVTWTGSPITTSAVAVGIVSYR